MFVCVQNQGKHAGKWVLGFTSHWHSCAQNNNNKQQQYQTFFFAVHTYGNRYNSGGFSIWIPKIVYSNSTSI
jgi:hypothetical protein